jgi:hypothetical protein
VPLPVEGCRCCKVCLRVLCTAVCCGAVIPVASAVYALPISAVGFSLLGFVSCFGSSYLNCGGMKDPSNVGIKISNRSEPNL